MNQSRLAQLSAAFRAVPLTCGPLTLRPITAGSVLLLMDTDNPLFSESQASSGPSDQSDMDGLFQFIYLHTAPVEEILETCEDIEILRRKGRQLGITISFEDLGEFSEKFQQIQQRMNAAIVEVIPEKDKLGKSKQDQPPTGSPPSSTTSAEPETQPASITSSGLYPSTEPSNTSTQPTPQTESGPVGRSRIWEDPAPAPQEDPTNLIPLP